MIMENYRNRWNEVNYPEIHVRPKSDKKELLVFAIYVNMGEMPMSKYQQKFLEMKNHINEMFGDVEEKTNYLVKTLFFPVKDQDTKIECVFPSNCDAGISKELINGIQEVLDSTDIDISTFIDDNEKNNDIASDIWNYPLKFKD